MQYFMPSYIQNKLSVKTELSLRVPVLGEQFPGNKGS